MLYVDTMKVLPGLLLLLTICSSTSGKDLDKDLKRTPLAKSESLIAESTEENPHRYSDHYESEKKKMPEGEHQQRYIDPAHQHYHQEKDEEVPQAYKFGYAIKDEHEGHQYRHEEKDEQGNVQGQFGYRDAKGQYRQVNYVADGYGFRAKVKTNEAGVDNQNPADVEIQKEEGQDYQTEYTRKAEGHSGDANVLYHSEKSSSTNYGHHQPATESKQPDVSDYYQRQPAIETKSRGASEHYHQQPVESEPHDASAEYYRQPVVKSEPSVDAEEYYQPPVAEREQNGATHYYQRQPVVESEPQENNYEYRKPVHQHTGYTHYSYPHSGEQQEVEYQQTKTDEEGSAPVTNQYFTKENHPQSENGYSSEAYEEMPPRTEVYKQVHKIVPPLPYVEKPSTRTPSTYQYQLEMDGPTYRYVKRPTHSGHEQPNADQHGKEYQSMEPEHKEANSHQMKAKERHSHNLGDYDELNKAIAEENYDSREQKLILPQSGGNDYNSYSYQSASPHNQEDSNQEYTNGGETLKYVYNGYPSGGQKLRDSKAAQPQTKAIPAMHQYVQIDTSEGSNPNAYNTDQVSYGHRYSQQEQRMVQPQQVVIMHPRNKIHLHEKPITYGDKNYHHKLPQTSSLQSLSYNIKNHDQQPLQKAVLELSPEVYKKLLENKSSGQRIVAIPAHGANGEHPASEPPHGMLHIHLDGESASTYNPKSTQLILSIGGKQNENSRNAGGKYEAHIPRQYHQYSPSSAAPTYKANTNLNRKEDDKNWIPMTPSWRSQVKRKPNNRGSSNSRMVHLRSPSDSTQVSNRDAFKFLQAESSNRAVDFQRQPPKRKPATSVVQKVIPGIYIINTTTRVSQLKDSKSTVGHKVVSVIRS